VTSAQTAVRAAIMSEIKDAEKKKKLGRPSLGKDARSVVLQSRVQKSEKIAYQKAAKSEGKALSNWIRDKLNEAAKV